MAKYMIHACKSRLWYVNNYLIPSMLDQNIAETDIILWVDEQEEGNLKSFLKSMEECSKYEEEGVWHLQDDVIICSNFKDRTEEYDHGFVAGFACSYDHDIKIVDELELALKENRPYDQSKVEALNIGEVPISKIWFSFCCIRIPTKYTKEFLEWWYGIALRDGEILRICINENRNDDYAFRTFIMNYHKELKAINLYPNLVNHIDHLLGGSITNPQRGERNVMSSFWDEDNLIIDLESRLKADGH